MTERQKILLLLSVLTTLAIVGIIAMIIMIFRSVIDGDILAIYVYVFAIISFISNYFLYGRLKEDKGTLRKDEQES